MNDALAKMLLDLKANRISKQQFKEAVNSGTVRAGEETGPELVRFGPVWERAVDDTAAAQIPRHVVLLAGQRQAAEALRARSGAFTVHLLESPAPGLAARYSDLACQVLDTVKRLLADPTLPRTLVQLVCPETGDDAPLSGLLAMLRTAALENPKVLP